MKNRRSNTIKSVLIAAGLFATVFAASATPADAKTHGRPDVRVHSSSHVAVRGHAVAAPRGVARRPFVVPRHVAFRSVRTYDPYYSSRAYFAPHRHYHAVYSFPVYSAYGVAYQPYTYCGDELYDGYGYDNGYAYGGGYAPSSHGPSGYVSFGGPHFGVTLGF